MTLCLCFGRVLAQKHLVGVQKMSCFGLKYLFWSSETALSVPWSLYKNMVLSPQTQLEILPRAPQVASHLQVMKRHGPSSRISSGFTLTNTKTQMWNCSSLAPLSTVTPPSSPPHPEHLMRTWCDMFFGNVNLVPGLWHVYRDLSVVCRYASCWHFILVTC